jgi:hypothetical protein
VLVPRGKLFFFLFQNLPSKLIIILGCSSFSCNFFEQNEVCTLLNPSPIEKGGTPLFCVPCAKRICVYQGWALDSGERNN